MKRYTLKTLPHETLQVVHPQRFMIQYKQELNPAQYEAVTSVQGPHLIIAGAGTGKTRTIVYRVAYLVELGIKPDHILLLTFTRKSAHEMLRRAAILLDSRCERISGGTFHSFANSVLRKHAPLLGYTPSFTIVDQSDAEDVLNLIRTRLKFDTKEKRFPRKEALYDLYSRSLNTQTPLALLLEDDYPQFLEQIEDIQKIFSEYEKYKKQQQLMDYDDLLMNLQLLLQQHDDVRRSLSSFYKYIMVDEYQDTNSVQASLAKLLASTHNNIMVVGDDAQSIYGFRGSTIKNILSFPHDYPDCRIIKLEENYRSTQPILNLANEILKRGAPMMNSDAEEQ